jgi:hypothetical protein
VVASPKTEKPAADMDDEVRAGLERDHKRPFWKSILTAGLCGVCVSLTAKLNGDSVSVWYILGGLSLFWIID